MARSVGFEPLEAAEYVVGGVLAQYEEETPLRFDQLDRLDPFVFDPTHRYLAKTSIDILSRKGRNLGSLVIVAFESGDGTGAESEDYPLRHLDFSEVRPQASNVPRSKSGLFAEVHIPLLDVELGESYAWQRVSAHAGVLDLVGFKPEQPGVVQKIGQLGTATEGRLPIEQRPTYTLLSDSSGRRLFGDPHVVCAPEVGEGERPRIVVAGFWGLTQETHSKYGNLIEAVLEPRYPSVN